MAIYVIHIDKAPISSQRAPVVYIGRNPRYGNPIYGNPFYLFKYGDRQLVLAHYRRWLSNVLPINDNLFEAFARLVFLALHGDLYLACHCAPDLCHGDVIKEYIEAALAERLAVINEDRS